jgi:glycerophosphoryl diester phosphodiesterase
LSQAAHRISTWDIVPGSLDYPLVIAHRGRSGVAPENTLEAFRQAIDAGADAIELDVRLTRDGRLAVIHDRRVDRTTSGTGVIGKLTLAEIKEFDAGSWFGPGFKSARVPTLDEVFEEVPHFFLVNVELKVRNHIVKRLVSAVVETVLRHRRLESTTVASFNPLALRVLRRREPRILRGYLWSARHPLPLRARWLSPLADPNWMGPALHTFTPELLQRFHSQGKLVLARDADVGTDLEHLRSMGLDGVLADDPEIFVRQRPQAG